MKPSLFFGILVVVSSWFACSSKTYFRIIPADMPIDTFSLGEKIKKISAQEYFFVETNISDSNVLDSNISIFARRNGDKMGLKYDHYVMYYYKSTPELNAKVISEYPDNLRYKAFYEISPVCTYIWDYGSLSQVEKKF